MSKCKSCGCDKPDLMYCPHCGTRDGDVQEFGVMIGGREARTDRAGREDMAQTRVMPAPAGSTDTGEMMWNRAPRFLRRIREQFFG